MSFKSIHCSIFESTARSARDSLRIIEFVAAAVNCCLIKFYKAADFFLGLCKVSLSKYSNDDANSSHALAMHKLSEWHMHFSSWSCGISAFKSVYRLFLLPRKLLARSVCKSLAVVWWRTWKRMESSVFFFSLVVYIVSDHIRHMFFRQNICWFI